MSILISFADQFFGSLTLTPTPTSPTSRGLLFSQPTTYDTLSTIKRRVHAVTQIPIEEMRLYWTDSWSHNGSYVGEEFRDSAILPYDSQLHLRLECSPTILYQFKLTKLAQSTRQEMIKQLQVLPIKFVGNSSIREVESTEQLAEVEKVKTQISIFNLTDQTQTISLEGEELQPVRLLPDNGGVECRGRFIGQYRAANQEMMTAVNEYDAKVGHCKKLLHDLPIALKNNKTALDEYMKENKSNPNYEEIATMTIERYRLEEEIESQQKKLKLLETKPTKVDPTKFELHTHQTSVIFPFGLTSFGGKLYSIVHVPSNSADVPTVLSQIIHTSTSQAM